MPMTPILHILSRADWSHAQQAGAYHPASLESEGFIHASSHEQIVRVANAFYAGRDDLLLLVIDPSLVHSPILLEPATDVADTFPHIHGPLNLDAVLSVIPYTPDPSGTFGPPSV